MKKIALIISFIIIGNICIGQKNLIKAAIKQGSLPSGIYYVDAGSSELYISSSSLKSVIEEMGYKAIDADYSGGRLSSFSFWKNPKHPFYFVDMSLGLTDGASNLSIVDNVIRETDLVNNVQAYMAIRGDEVVFNYGRINPEKKKYESPFFSCVNFSFKQSHYRTYPWANQHFFKDNEELVVLKDYALQYFKNDIPIFSYKMWENWSPYFNNDWENYRHYNSTTKKSFEKVVEKEMKKDLDNILNSQTARKLKTILILSKIHAWYCATWGFESARGFVREIGDDYYKKSLLKEEPFSSKEELDHFLTIFKKIHKRSDVPYKDYLKIKEIELEGFVKESKEEMLKKSIAYASEKNVILRNTFNSGVIGEDYIPAIYGKYNAGPKFKIDGKEIQVDDYQTYVKSGGYSEKVKGYTAVYQLINQSSKNYIIPIRINCTGLFSDTRRQSALSQLFNLSNNAYKKYTEETPIVYERSFLLKAGESIKDQVIVGETQPSDFELIVDGEIIEVSNQWMTDLIKALEGTDLEMIERFLSDEKALPWRNTISHNKEKVQTDKANKFSDSYKPNINSNILILKENIFDIDFESEVKVTVSNRGAEKVKIWMTSPWGEEILELEPGESFSEIREVKGVKKADLVFKVNKIAKNL